MIRAHTRTERRERGESKAAPLRHASLFSTHRRAQQTTGGHAGPPKTHTSRFQTTPGGQGKSEEENEAARGRRKTDRKRKGKCQTEERTGMSYSRQGVGKCGGLLSAKERRKREKGKREERGELREGIQ